MDNDELTMMEELLKPRCEFRASAGLKDRIMSEASRRTASRSTRLWPWIAVACTAAAVVTAIILPAGGGAKMAQDTTPDLGKSVAAVEKSIEKAVTTTDDTPKTEQETTQEVAPPVNKKVRKAKADIRLETPETAEKATENGTITEALAAPIVTAEVLAETATVNTGKADTTEAANRTGEYAMTAVPPTKPEVLNEMNMLITRPENLIYTPEEIALMKKRANEAYINWMKLELEITNVEMECTAKIIKQKK